MKSLIYISLLLYLIDNAYTYFVTIDAHAEECYFEKVNTGTKLSLMFEVAEGGFLDIDVKIIGPDDKVIYSGDRESNGKYTFAAHNDGIYKYCFSNKMSSVTPKVVLFTMDIGEPKKIAFDDKDTDENHKKLEILINELATGLAGVSQEQKYMEVRERNHRNINENTNSRVVMWSFFEALVLIAMTLGQIFYLKRFFEVRRNI